MAYTSSSFYMLEATWECVMNSTTGNPNWIELQCQDSYLPQEDKVSLCQFSLYSPVISSLHMQVDLSDPHSALEDTLALIVEGRISTPQAVELLSIITELQMNSTLPTSAEFQAV